MNPIYTSLKSIALASTLAISSASGAIIYDSGTYSYSNGTSFNLVTPTGVRALTFTGGVNSTGGGISYITMPTTSGAATSSVKSAAFGDDLLAQPVSSGITVSSETGDFSPPTTMTVYLMLDRFYGSFLGATHYIAFSFKNESVVNYGWALVAGSPASSAGSVTGWAYESTGDSIAVGAIPEPSSAVLGCAGAFAFAFGYRRRRAA